MYKQLVLVAAISLAIGHQVVRQPATAQQQQPTGYELINRALAAGQIDVETAHEYRVFAAFTDRRLPQQYRGGDSTVEEVPPFVDAIGELLPTLSAQTQAELAPFFMSPVDPGSWLHLATVSGEPPAPPPSPENGDHTLFWEPRSDANFPNNSGGPEVDVVLARPSFTDRDSAYNRQQYGLIGAWNGLARRTIRTQCDEVAATLLINSARPLVAPHRFGCYRPWRTS